MRICTSVPELRVALAGAPRPLGFFPTMGALHDGHAAVLRRCRAENATAVASIFVNPLQFSPDEDFARYPRTPEADRELLAGLGIDVLFAPEAFYPAAFATRVEMGAPAEGYEAAQRAGHFAGVCTVVLKLLLSVGPDRAYFARKDAQQLAVVTRMARDLDLPVEIVPAETVRDADGLALSSRNAYLSADERERALGLSRGLRRAEALWREGERDPARLVEAARDPALEYDYLACVDAATFGPPAAPPCYLVAAVRVGSTRLLDNVHLA